MQLSTGTIFILFLCFVFVWQVYSVYGTRYKIWCSFRRADRTKIEKWAKEGQRKIVFDGGWYDVEPDRTTLMIKWNPLPMWVRCLDFRHDSSRALHPATFDNAYSPEARKQLDKSDDIEALESGNRQAILGKAGKQGIFDRWFPVIVLLGFVVVGFMLWQSWQKMDMIGTGQNVIEQQMGDILNKLGGQ